MAPKEQILQKIKELSSKSEVFYAGIKEELAAKMPIGDISSTAFDILNQILADSENDNIAGLKERLSRLDELKKTIALVDDKGEETKYVTESFDRVETALKEHIKEKQKKLNRAKDAIKNNMPDVLATLETAFSDNPLVTLAFKSSRKIQEMRNRNKAKNSGMSKKDYESFYTNELKNSDSNTQTESFAQSSPNINNEAGPLSNNIDMEAGPLSNYSSDISSGPSIRQDEQNTEKIITTLVEISGDVKKLVRYYAEEQEEKDEQGDDAAFDNLEAELEAKKASASLLMEKQKNYGTDTVNSSMPGNPDSGGVLNSIFENVLGASLGTKISKIGSNLLGKAGGFAGKVGGLAKGGIGTLGKAAGSVAGLGILGKAGNVAKGAAGGLGKIGSGLLKGGGKALGSMGLKSAVKKIPLIGALAGAGFAAKRLFDGDLTGAGLELMSGLAGTVPGAGTAASLGLDVALAARDNKMNESTSDITDTKEIFDNPTATNTKLFDNPTTTDTKKIFNNPMSNLLSNKKETTWNQEKEEFIKKQAEENAKALLDVFGEKGFLGSATMAAQKSRQQNAARQKELLAPANMAAQKSKEQSATTNAAEKLLETPKIQSVPTESLISSTPSMVAQGSNYNSEQMKSLALKELAAKGITDPTQQANILANLEAESNFKPRSENIEKYSAKTLMRLYGPGSGNKVRFNTLEEAQAAVDAGPEKVGNIIYGGRMGNAADEGYKFRGRGLVQLTGKDNYTAMSKKLGIDLVSNPDLANDPAIAAKIQAQYYADRKKQFNYGDITQVAKATGHAGGAKETEKRAQIAQNYMTQISSGKLSADSAPQIMPAVLDTQNNLPNKNYTTVAQNTTPKSNSGQTINVVNNTTKTSGGSNTVGNDDAPPIGSNGTSSRGASFGRGWLV